MTRRDNLVAVGSIPEGTEQPEAREPREAVNMDELVADQVWDNEYEEDEAARSRFGWVVPSLAVLAIVAWTGFFGWSHQAEALNGATPEEFSHWIVAWSIPVVLVVSLWLLAMRHSRREASRFADVAAAMSR